MTNTFAIDWLSGKAFISRAYRCPLRSWRTDPSRLPTFLGVGTSKCGTTWVWSFLNEHPEVGFPVNPIVAGKKEFNFWNDYRSEITTEQYLRAFFECDRPVMGEFSPDYVNSTESLSRIRYCLPGVKIICGFRNPVFLFHSSYHHVLRNSGNERPFREWFLEYIKSMHEHFNFDRAIRISRCFQRKMYSFICSKKPSQSRKLSHVDSSHSSASIPISNQAFCVHRSTFATNIDGVNSILLMLEFFIRDLRAAKRQGSSSTLPIIRPIWVDALVAP